VRSGAAVDLASAEVEARAEQLYARYGGRPWRLVPEQTRQHFGGLVADGIDGAGQPLEATG
jgi:hypothetical protein